ncbi:hypothetical protein FACS189483_06110 [Spirochaetia bacterium]|nr:hypothetical protein FACS189483_06110 [Spirochaetia bacterium]
MEKRNSSPVTIVIALVCIAAYIAALGYAAYRLYINIRDRQVTAEMEFRDLSAAASQAGVLGFMTDAFQNTIQETITKSRTLEGAIITGPEGEYAFERNQGGIIRWAGDSPRFDQRFGVSSKTKFAPLDIAGLRNVTIGAVYRYIDYDYVLLILKQTLLVVLATLALSLLTLIINSAISKSTVTLGEAEHIGKTAVKEDIEAAKAEHTGKTEGLEKAAVPEETVPPRGPYSPRSNIGWEDTTLERLEQELHRAASTEEDLVLIAMELRGDIDERTYCALADAAVGYFKLRDCTFEKGETGIVVIIPNIDLDQGLVRAEEFLNTLSDDVTGTADTRIGLSSRSGRGVDARRLLFEAAQATERALMDPAAPIIAFRIDPEKYRKFIHSRVQ